MAMVRKFVDVLTEAEVLKLHEESLTVLETVGMSVPHAKVLEACEKIGCVVDHAAQRVKVPRALTQELLTTFKPKEPAPEEASPIKGSVSTQVFIVDYPGTVRREGTMMDVRKGARVTDTLKNFWNSSAVVIPKDRAYNETDIASFRELYLYSKNPGGTYILSPESGRGIIEMGRVMGQKPGYLLETISPLGFMGSSLSMALVFAEAGMPIGTAPMVVSGATGPMSLWGTCVLELAEVTGTNVVIYALSGKFSNYLSFSSHTMDLRTTLCSFGSPTQALFGMVSGQMGRFYGWGGGSNSALSDACLPDYQCGFEKAFNGLFAVLSGTNGIGCQGIVGADQGVSLEQLVIDNDWLDAYNFVRQGVYYDPDALPLIQEVGIAGNFFAEEHTLEHMRRSYWEAPSRTLWRDQWEPWRRKETPDLYARAHEVVEKVSAGYETMDPVLDAARAGEIDRIYQDTLKALRKNP